MHQGTIAKWVSTGLFSGLLVGLGHSKTSLLCADLLNTNELKVLENDGKDNVKIKKNLKILYLEKICKILDCKHNFSSLDLIE